MIAPENIVHHEDGSVTLTPAGVAQLEKAWARVCRSIEQANEALFPALTIAQSWTDEILRHRGPSLDELKAALCLMSHPGPLPVPPYDKRGGVAMKKTKEEVDYSRGMKSAHCSICRNFSKRLARDQFGSCELVKGTINVGMWCKLYAAKR